MSVIGGSFLPGVEVITEREGVVVTLVIAVVEGIDMSWTIEYRR